MESVLTGSLLPLVVVILNMWSICLALDANSQCACFGCLEERDANFRADPLFAIAWKERATTWFVYLMDTKKCLKN